MKINSVLIAASLLIGIHSPGAAIAQETLSAEEIKLLKEIIADYESKNSSTLALDSFNKQQVTAKVKALFMKGSTSEPFNYSVLQPETSGGYCYKGKPCIVKNVDDTSGTGYEVAINYKPDNSPYFVYGSYRQLNADAQDSFTADEFDSAGLLGMDSPPHKESCSSLEAPCEVQGRQSLFVDSWSIGTGIDFQPTGYLTLTPSIAITKVYANENRFASSGAVGQPGDDGTLDQISSYQGWGPRLGLGASLAVAKNLSVNFASAAALTYGNIESSYAFDDGAINPSRLQSTQSTWVPTIGAGVDVAYDIELSDTLLLSLNAGYEFDYYWGATSIISSNTFDQADAGEFMGSKGDISFSGFNLGLGMTYKF